MKWFRKYDNDFKYIHVIDVNLKLHQKTGISNRVYLTIKRNQKLNTEKNPEKILRHIKKNIVCKTIWFNGFATPDLSIETAKNLIFKDSEDYEVEILEGDRKDIEVGDIFEICETYKEYIDKKS